jgi:hypothetical protein
LQETLEFRLVRGRDRPGACSPRSVVGHLPTQRALPSPRPLGHDWVNSSLDDAPRVVSPEKIRAGLVQPRAPRPAPELLSRCGHSTPRASGSRVRSQFTARTPEKEASPTGRPDRARPTRGRQARPTRRGTRFPLSAAGCCLNSESKPTQAARSTSQNAAGTCTARRQRTSARARTALVTNRSLPPGPAPASAQLSVMLSRT